MGGDMSKMDRREMVGGLLLTLLGLGFASYAYSSYAIGKVTRMGPGMVPTILGLILAVFGLAIIYGARSTIPDRREIKLYVPTVILGSVVAFAVLINSFGMIPAVIASTMISILAEKNPNLRKGFVLAIALAFLAWLIFVLGLRLPVPVLKWPF